MKYIKYILLFVAFAGCISGCIDEFQPEGIEEVSDLLIIDGTITDGESKIVLRYSVGLTEYLTGNEYIDGATVYVETDTGEEMKAIPQGRGLYIVPTGPLDANKQYRLNVVYRSEQYRSTFLTPLFTPEIDSISSQKKGPGETVYMCVNTHDPENRSRYYRWSYKEVWEVQAELYANAYWVSEDSVQLLDLSTPNNYYYCWGRDSSKILHLGSTEKLSENVVSYKRLQAIEPGSDRLSVLYHFSVEQNQLRKEAYDYMFNLQKNIEQTGSIFTPMPSEMKGNISCITNPDLPVIGYIEVSTTTRKDRYFPFSDGLYESPWRGCFNDATDDPDYKPPVYAYYEYYPDISPPLFTFAPHKCVDCRLKERASKTKPENWPTSHL